MTVFHAFVPDVSIAEKLVRTVVVYAFLIGGLRVAGKRELSQLNPFDLVVLLLLSNTVQNAIIGNDNSVVGGLIGAATLMAANYAMVRFLYRHERFDRVIEGKAEVLVEHGRVLKDRLDAELITMAELEAAAHRQGFESLDMVERAVLETGGGLTFVGKRPTDDTVRQQDLLRQLEEIKQLLKARV
jgi:uncharacterized membrane protein YcaP (DUF421 family)